jgi:hypothetical protein
VRGLVQWYLQPVFPVDRGMFIECENNVIKGIGMARVVRQESDGFKYGVADTLGDIFWTDILITPSLKVKKNILSRLLVCFGKRKWMAVVRAKNGSQVNLYPFSTVERILNYASQ